MSDEQLARLFGEYERFDENFRYAIEGTGLGLSIVRRLVDLMDGEISVTSTQGKGSRFAVSLPQGRVDDEVIGRENAANLSNSHMQYSADRRNVPVTYEAMPYGSILIVDDVETNLYIAQGLMNLFKLKSETVTSGSEAIKKIARGDTYDVIFMDHMMPELDGVKATRLIRDLGYSKPIVALTANVLAEQEKMYLENGFDGFVPKPIELKLLNEVLCRFVRDVHKPNRSPQEGDLPQEIAAAPPPESVTASEAVFAPAKPDAALVKLFVKDARKAADMIEELLAESSFDEVAFGKYVTMIHGLKSALRNIGEIELSKVAEMLEKHGRDGNETEVVQHTPELFDKLRKLIDFYSN
jgi:CheY-like chemotaxis protein